jgi:hypothetical protein
MTHLYVSPSMLAGPDYGPAIEDLKRQASDGRTLCGLPLPAVIDKRAEADLPAETRCDVCVASGAHHNGPKFVVLPG